jgi:hypothetical protein
MRPAVFVASTETADGERFFVVQPDAFPAPHQRVDASISLSEWGRLAPEERLSAWQRLWQRYMEAATLLTEQDVRRHLAAAGLSADAVDAQVQRARRARANTAHWIASGEQFIWESTTAIGYRNRDDQVVLHRTDLSGSRLYQRVYLMRCDQCGHEYGVDGCDVHNRRCPNCQGGPPGLPTSNIHG